jgi:hypothetical protein
MLANFYLNSDRFLASSFSFFLQNNPSHIITIIINIIIFLSMVRPVAYSEFAMPVSFLDVPHLSYLWDYIQKRFLNSLSIRSEPFKAYWLRDAPASLSFNNCTLSPHCMYVFCIYLITNSGLCPLHHKQFGFYKQNENCSQRGTDWVFK